MTEPDLIETDLVDLNHTSLADLTGVDLDDQIRQATAPLRRPRKNLGSSGPPGRVD